MDVYITKLRKILKADPEVEILNVHGKGYKIISPQTKKENEA
jgi:DNA-binding response OmpR family regulator